MCEWQPSLLNVSENRHNLAQHMIIFPFDFSPRSVSLIAWFPLPIASQTLCRRCTFVPGPSPPPSPSPSSSLSMPHTCSYFTPIFFLANLFHRFPFLRSLPASPPIPLPATEYTPLPTYISPGGGVLRFGVGGGGGSGRRAGEGRSG